jgi:lipoprotein-anchoring transpeptidase ErfK/SrfK
MTRPARHIPGPRGFRRGVTGLAVALFTAGAGCIPAAPALAASPGVPASEPRVVLLHDQFARTSPNARARRIELIGGLRPLTRVRTVLPVLGYAHTGLQAWVRVRLPGRPNGHAGWIPARQTRRTSTGWHIFISLSARLVTVYHYGRAEQRFLAVVGKPSTPTPQGEFFVEEPLALSSQAAGAPFALATSARSNVLQEFDGGPGQIGIHGTDNLSGNLGTAASHGCIRLNTGAITWLAERIGAGVPVTVTA